MIASAGFIGWWITQQDQRVLPRVLGDLTEVIQELALLASAGMGVARRQSARQVVPTGLLHLLIVVAPGRICFEANLTSRAGKILRQRARGKIQNLSEHMCYYSFVLAGRRYRLEFNPLQRAYAERVAGACRAVWNAALEQRRIAVDLNRHKTNENQLWPSLVSQSRELTEAKHSQDWLTEVPRECLQQTLRDLERACWQHGPSHVAYRSKRRSTASFRFSGEKQIGKPRRLNRRWGECRLPKIGPVRFCWTRPLGGAIRNTTVIRDGEQWYIAFCVDVGVTPIKPSGLPPVGIDRGVAIPVATSDGRSFPFTGIHPGEKRRLKRLHQRLSRQTKASRRRRATVGAIGRMWGRVRHRRADFAHQTAHQLTTAHGLIVIENLRIKSMTRSAKGTNERPGRNVRQKAGLNRAILDKTWGRLRLALKWHGQKNGCAVVGVAAAYTSQTCSACGHTAPESRESQARFRCVACGYQDNADVNAAKNILAAGLAVTGRGDLGGTRSAKRQPPVYE